MNRFKRALLLFWAAATAVLVAIINKKSQDLEKANLQVDKAEDDQANQKIEEDIKDLSARIKEDDKDRLSKERVLNDDLDEFDRSGKS